MGYDKDMDLKSNLFFFCEAILRSFVFFTTTAVEPILAADEAKEYPSAVTCYQRGIELRVPHSCN